MKTKPLIHTLNIAFGGFAFIAPTAMAQSQPQNLERVEITGSSVKRIEKESALPVQIIRKEEIERSGAKSVAELIQNLPSMQGFTSITESVGASGNGFAGASIHNLGETRTLVMLNGRRIATFAGQTLTGALAGIDLNTISIAAVERIEILTDGASALYGSDAIGGVVNFILKKTFNGGEVSAGYTAPQQKGAEESRVSATIGFGNFDKDRFNVLIAASHDARKALAGIDRPFSKTGSLEFDLNGTRYGFINDSFRGAPGNATPFNSDWVRNVYEIQNGKCPEQHFLSPDGVGSNYCRFDYTASLEISPKVSRDSLLASTNFKLNDNHTLFADLLFARSSTLSRIAPPPVDIVIEQGSTFYNTYAPILGAVPSDGDLFVGWRGTDFGRRTIDDKSTATHLSFGSKGLIGKYDYSAGYVYSVNKHRQYYVDGWIARNGLDAALTSGTINPFVAAGQQTPTALTAIANAKALGLFQASDSTLSMFEARISGDVGKFSSGTVLFGAGLDFRSERVKYVPGLFAQGITDGIAGDDSQTVPFDVTRNVTGLFAELVVPVTKSFEMTGSLRTDNYSDFGNATTYKLQGRFQPTKTLLVRGSVGTGFKAPSVPQLAGPIQQLYGVTSNNYDCPFGPTDPLAQFCPPRSIQYNAYAGANPKLKPEESRQWTLGVLFEPTANVSLGADFWGVKIKNTIGTIDEAVIFADPVRYRSNFTTYLDPVSGVTQLAMYTQNQNLGVTDQSGIDLTATGRFALPFGRLTSSFTATYMTKYEYERTPGDGFFTNLGAYSDGGVTLRYQARLANTLEYGRWAHTMVINVKPGYTDQEQEVLNLTTGDYEVIKRRVSAYTTIDWQSRWNYSKAFKFSFGILNVLGTKPPLTIKSEGGQQIGFDNRYTDPRGRTFYLDGTFSF